MHKGFVPIHSPVVDVRRKIKPHKELARSLFTVFVSQLAQRKQLA